MQQAWITFIKTGNTLQTTRVYHRYGAPGRKKTLPQQIEHAEQELAGINWVEGDAMFLLECINEINQLRRKAGITATMINDE